MRRAEGGEGTAGEGRAEYGERKKASASGKFPEAVGRAADKAGAVVGLSGKTYERAKAVVQAAKAEPRKYGSLVEEMDKSRRVNGVFRKLSIARQAESLKAESSKKPKTPGSAFGVIVADPPWSYTARAKDASHRAMNPYDSMSIEQIAAYFQDSWSLSDSILWLWATNAHLPAAFGIAERWGFTYKTLLTWNKKKIGLGDWLRGQTEHCLFCIRGKPVIQLKNQSTFLSAPSGRHSAKPDEFYALVERLCPDERRLELFSRKQRSGWCCHGLEV